MPKAENRFTLLFFENLSAQSTFFVSCMPYEEVLYENGRFFRTESILNFAFVAHMASVVFKLDLELHEGV